MNNAIVKIGIYVCMSIICFVLGSTVFNGLIFLSIAPIVALRNENNSEKLVDKIKYIFLMPLVLVVGNFLAGFFSGYENSMSSLILYSLASLLPFLLLEISEHFAPNKWGVLMIVVYWIAMEYLLLKLHPELSNYFLANSLPEQWFGWNGYSGFLGGSVLVLLGNVLLYYSLLKNYRLLKGKIGWISFIFSAILIIVIIWWGYSFDPSEIISLPQMKETYQSHSMVVENSSYAENGELYGRIALWITTMVFLYVMVKGKMAKK